MDFGIDANRVYANDDDANPAFWTVFPGHVHGQIVQALKADTAVQVAIQAKLNAPNDGTKRGFAIDLINRATVNCIGQHIVGQPMHPEKADFTLYNLLAGGTAAAIDQVLGADADTAVHKAFADKSADEIIAIISRQTGRALFQTCVAQLTQFALNPGNIVSKLKDALLSAAKGIVPGLP